MCFCSFSTQVFPAFFGVFSNYPTRPRRKLDENLMASAVDARATASASAEVQHIVMYVKSLAGDLLEIEVRADAQVSELKSAIASLRSDFPVHEQRLAVMPDYPHSDAHVILENQRSLSSYACIHTGGMSQRQLF